MNQKSAGLHTQIMSYVLIEVQETRKRMKAKRQLPVKFRHRVTE